MENLVLNCLLPCGIGEVGTAGIGPGLGRGPKPPTMLVKKRIFLQNMLFGFF